MDKERSKLIKELAASRKTLQSLLEMPSVSYNYGFKNAEDSVKIRSAGNELFLQKQHDHHLHKKIFAHYCKSVMAAPNNSQELALAYGNRSAFLVHVKRYKECIEDVDKALEIPMPDGFKAKLLHRKVECLKQLELTKYLDDFEKSQHYNKLDKNEYNIHMEKLLKVTATDLNNSGTKAAPILPKTDKPLDYVKIKYNEKYGRHLIARKDYNPGDIIFVEDLYANIVSSKFKYTNCHYCFKTAWSGIPCDHCNWATFCSRDCKLKAWEAYHDIECLLISSTNIGSDELYIEADFTLRVFIVAFKEAGSIEKLKEELAAVGKSIDVVYKGFYRNGEFKSQTLHSILSLKSSDPSDEEIQAILQDIPKLLINLIKFTQVLEDFYPKSIEDVIENEDAVFLGSLLTKFAAMKKNYSLALTPEVLHCTHSTFSEDCYVDTCIPLGSCLGSLSSLINHSCNPNANRFFTEDRKIVIYAQHPIKKNSQIFNHYYCHFAYLPLAERQRRCKSYNFKCECNACTEDWHVTLASSSLFIDRVLVVQIILYLKTGIAPNCNSHENYYIILKVKNDRNISQMELWSDYYLNTSKKLLPNKEYSRKIVIEDIKKICQVISGAFQIFKEPIDIVSYLNNNLNTAYVAMFGLEKLLLSKCDKMI